MSLTGGCLCGRVRFAVTTALPGADACHCVQSRKAGKGDHYEITDGLPQHPH